MARTITFSLSAIAKVGVADHMPASGEAIDVESIAVACGAQPEPLFRTLRLLASVGVMEQEGRRFGLTPVGVLLRKDAPASLRNVALLCASPWNVNSYMRMSETLLTGEDGVKLVYGKSSWQLLPELPEQAELYHRAMQDHTAIAIRALLEVYDFHGVTCLADVGGGYGTLLAGVLAKYPKMEGVLFDMPSVIEGARNAALLADLSERVWFEEGDFLEKAPSGCDAYMLKHILHDWSDEDCRKILRLIRAKMPSKGKVLIFELIVPESEGPSPAKGLDIEMLVTTSGGRERTEGEFEDLLKSAGFRMNRIVPATPTMSVMEALPA